MGKSGEDGEQQVWDAVREVFADRECIGYWRYPIFSKVGKSRKEPDILIADAQLGLIVIEIKSVTIDQIQKRVAEHFDIPFVHVPVDAGAKPARCSQKYSQLRF